MIIFDGTFYKTNPIFGRLTVLQKAGVNKQNKTTWLCGCLCGNYHTLSTTELKRTSRATKTCGACYDDIKYPKEYKCWEGMYARCYSSYRKDYKNYGGRGITVQQSWRQDFLFFLMDVGLAPSKDHSLDRIDVNGNYEKGNVRWATKIEQANNTRGTVMYRLGF
jgi:hypothetical protein